MLCDFKDALVKDAGLSWQELHVKWQCSPSKQRSLFATVYQRSPVQKQLTSLLPRPNYWHSQWKFSLPTILANRISYQRLDLVWIQLYCRGVDTKNRLFFIGPSQAKHDGAAMLLLWRSAMYPKCLHLCLINGYNGTIITNVFFWCQHTLQEKKAFSHFHLSRDRL